MALFLVRFGYTPESWAALVQNPEGPPRHARGSDLRPGLTAARLLVLARGVRRVRDHWEYPDEVAAAAAHVALKAAGTFRHLEATALMSVEEMVEAHAARE